MLILVNVLALRRSMKSLLSSVSAYSF